MDLLPSFTSKPPDWIKSNKENEAGTIECASNNDYDVSGPFSGGSQHEKNSPQCPDSTGYHHPSAFLERDFSRHNDFPSFDQLRSSLEVTYQRPGTKSKRPGRRVTRRRDSFKDTAPTAFSKHQNKKIATPLMEMHTQSTSLSQVTLNNFAATRKQTILSKLFQHPEVYNEEKMWRQGEQERAHQISSKSKDSWTSFAFSSRAAVEVNKFEEQTNRLGCPDAKNDSSYSDAGRDEALYRLPSSPIVAQSSPGGQYLGIQPTSPASTINETVGRDVDLARNNFSYDDSEGSAVEALLDGTLQMHLNDSYATEVVDVGGDDSIEDIEEITLQSYQGLCESESNLSIIDSCLGDIGQSANAKPYFPESEGMVVTNPPNYCSKAPAASETETAPHRCAANCISSSIAMPVERNLSFPPNDNAIGERGQRREPDAVLGCAAFHNLDSDLDEKNHHIDTSMPSIISKSKEDEVTQSSPKKQSTDNQGRSSAEKVTITGKSLTVQGFQTIKTRAVIIARYSDEESMDLSANNAEEPNGMSSLIPGPRQGSSDLSPDEVAPSDSEMDGRGVESVGVNEMNAGEKANTAASLKTTPISVSGIDGNTTTCMKTTECATQEPSTETKQKPEDVLYNYDGHLVIVANSSDLSSAQSLSTHSLLSAKSTPTRKADREVCDVNKSAFRKILFLTESNEARCDSGEAHPDFSSSRRESLSSPSRKEVREFPQTCELRDGAVISFTPWYGSDQNGAVEHDADDTASQTVMERSWTEETSSSLSTPNTTPPRSITDSISAREGLADAIHPIAQRLALTQEGPDFKTHLASAQSNSVPSA